MLILRRGRFHAHICNYDNKNVAWKYCYDTTYSVQYMFKSYSSDPSCICCACAEVSVWAIVIISDCCACCIVMGFAVREEVALLPAAQIAAATTHVAYRGSAWLPSIYVCNIYIAIY